MAEVVANSEVAVRTKPIVCPALRAAAAVFVALGTLFSVARAVAQQNGPPASGNSAAILFVPATLNPVSGFNPANGHLNTGGYGGDGMPANSSSSLFSYPVGIAYDSNGNLFIADENNYVVRRIDAVTGDLSTFAGQQDNRGFYPPPGVSAPAASAQFFLLAGLVIDSSNNIYVSDRTSNVIWKITPDQVVSVFAGAGTGSCGIATDSLGDGCPATDATLNNPWALGIDANNNIYIADSYNDLVRKVSSSTGIITIFAGVAADAGTFGDCNASLYSVSGSGPYLATQAHLGFPEGIAFDSMGNAYISSATCDMVQKVDSNGYISTFAGTRNVRGTSGDGGPATSATLNEPSGIYVDPANRVYISDFFGGEIRIVDSTGNINAVMGNTHGELNNASIGEPDTEPIYNSSTGQYSGAADGIYSILMDPYGNIVASDSSGDAITSAGTTGAYYFGSQQIYQTVSTTSLNTGSSLYPPSITISNPSNVTLNFTDAPVVTTATPSASPAAFSITGGTCSFPGALAPGASCTVIVSFMPTTAAAYTGTIVLDSNANSSPNTISLSGAGTGTCIYSASLTSSLNFGGPPNVTTATQAATLTNTGICPISSNVSSAAIINNNPTGSSAFTLASNNCPATLNGGDSCTFNVSFTPTALTSYSAELQVNIPSYGNIHTILDGTGIVAPAVSFNPASITFPSTTDGSTASAMSTVMTNVGNASLVNIVIALAGTNPSYFAFSGTNNCGTSLAAGASCTISVDFIPQSSITNYSAAISVADNTANSPQTVGLTGTGTAALLPVVVNDNEVIHATDIPGATLPVLVLDNETVHTTDTPSFPQTVLIADKESIHTTDAPAITPALLVVDNEAIHTTDTPSFAQSALILDTEVIHTTDTPAVKILTSPTTTLLTASTATPAAGNPVTFTATVTSIGGTPTGNVTFYDGTIALVMVSLNNGTAIYSTSSLSDSSHSISAVYAGNANFLGSTSNILAEMVTDFTLSLGLGGGPGLTILPGRSGTYTILLTPPSNGYSGTISLSASGLPTGATASFNPNQVTLGSNPVTSTLTITIPAASAQVQPISSLRTRTPLLLGALLSLLGLRRVRRRGLRLLLLSCICILGVSSCGGPFFNQPKQTYTVTITGASGTNSHSTTITLTVP